MEKDILYIIDRAGNRGYAEHGGWLKTYHSFSFADYFNPDKMGFGVLRVLNDDSIAPRNGFGPHPHRDMEIITIPFEGELTHKDSMGNKETIKAGEVQRMSAGTGVMHSEFNLSETQTVRLFQIWLLTRDYGITPSYEQKGFDKKERKNKFQLIVSPDARDGSISVNQDAYFSLADLDIEVSIKYSKYKKENGLYIIVIEGEVEILAETLNRRDAIGIANSDDIVLIARKNSEVLIMEIPMTDSE